MKAKHQRIRRGTTTVEAAFVLPVFFVFLFAIIQFGHANMAKHMMQHACRTAARLGATEGVTTAEVEAKVRELVRPVMDPDKVTVLVKDGSVFDGDEDHPASDDDYNNMPDLELSTTESRKLFLVRAQVRYNDVAMLPWDITENVMLTTQAFMRHE